MKKIVLLLLIGFPLLKTFAQDANFSQFYASPLTLNPALTGKFHGTLRVAGNYRNQWPTISHAFISAYRKHHRDGTFEISLEYISCPDLQDRILILSDPMLATGSSLVKTIQFLKDEGPPSQIHIVTAIACTVGIEYLRREEPQVKIWCGDIDDELTAKGYIVPGLGDAGDLAFGTKVQI